MREFEIFNTIQRKQVVCLSLEKKNDDGVLNSEGALVSQAKVIIKYGEEVNIYVV